ncbi:hypothetical protein D3C77_469200 [compost metagenome]
MAFLLSPAIRIFRNRSFRNAAVRRVIAHGARTQGVIHVERTVNFNNARILYASIWEAKLVRRQDRLVLHMSEFYTIFTLKQAKVVFARSQ